jgi:hypothetical protein
MFLDVLQDGAQPALWQRTVPPLHSPTRCHEMPDQMHGQDIGQRLGGKASPDTASRQFGIDDTQSSQQLGNIQRVERGNTPRAGSRPNVSTATLSTKSGSR